MIWKTISRTTQTTIINGLSTSATGSGLAHGSSHNTSASSREGSASAQGGSRNTSASSREGSASAQGGSDNVNINTVLQKSVYVVAAVAAVAGFIKILVRK